MNTTFRGVCERAAADWGVPSLAVGSAVGGRVESLGVGCAPETRFHVASITKPFTAALALGLLDLDEPTGVWPDDVRVRHLLSHTSGFDCECGDLARFGDGDDALERVAAALPEVRRLVGTDAAWSYANSGYWLAGRLCSVRAGCTYEEALARDVLGPWGLDATSFAGAEVAGSGPDATGDPYPRARRPSGGLVSNVPDLLRFGDRLLASPLFPRLATPHAKTAGGVYGLGLAGERVGGVDVWGHRGSWGGYQSSLLLVPDRGAVFAGLTSSGRGKQALRIVEDAWLEELLGVPRGRAETVPLPAGELERFAGAYENTDGRTEVRVSGDGLAVSLEEGEFPGRPVGGTRFEIMDGDLAGDRFDFPLAGFGRFGSRLAERVA